MRVLPSLSSVFLGILLACSSASAEPGTVKVIVLAGQSNMEGKAQNKLLKYQASAPETAEQFSHLRRGDQWIVRDDVWSKYLKRHGPLTIGYGSRDRTGVELEFGNILGNIYFIQPCICCSCSGVGFNIVPFKAALAVSI